MDILSGQRGAGSSASAMGSNIMRLDAQLSTKILRFGGALVAFR